LKVTNVKTQYSPSADDRRTSVSGTIRFLLLALLIPAALASAASQPTEAQREALAKRVGTIYWVAAVNNRIPAFLAAPATNAPSLSAGDNESFEIVELTRQKDKEAYYKVKFESGKVGYIRPEVFVEELNLTILTADPLADEKKKAAAAEEEERKRVKWIGSQPWSAAVKEAAVKRIPVPGLTAAEVKNVLGNPARITKGPGLRGSEELWHYADGAVLTFHNRLLNRVDLSGRKEP
jgi:hypothetical protein